MNTSEYNHAVEQWADHLFRFALKLCKNQITAEDLVQEAFATMWEHRNKVPVEKAKPYLFQVLYRKFIDIYRYQQRWTGLDVVSDIQTSYEDPQPDIREVIERALHQLPPPQKAVIMLRDWEGYSYREIGAITGLSASQVKVYLFRARKKMKELLVDISNIQ